MGKALDWSALPDVAPIAVALVAGAPITGALPNAPLDPVATPLEVLVPEDTCAVAVAKNAVAAQHNAKRTTQRYGNRFIDI